MIQFDCINLFVNDVERSLIFYRDLCQFKFEQPIKNSGVEGYRLEQNHKLKIGIYDLIWLKELFDYNSEISNPAIPTTAFLLSFSVTDLDSIYQDLLIAKVNVVKPPTIMPWGQKVIFFTDPDRNLIEFVQKEEHKVIQTVSN